MRNVRGGNSHDLLREFVNSIMNILFMTKFSHVKRRWFMDVAGGSWMSNALTLMRKRHLTRKASSSWNEQESPSTEKFGLVIVAHVVRWDHWELIVPLFSIHLCLGMCLPMFTNKKGKY